MMRARPVGVVTGGLSGIGAACALEFARLGARLLLADRSLTNGDEVRSRVRDAGGDAIVELIDVRDPEAQQRLAERAVAEWGRIDFLLANAGIAEQSSVATGDPARWRMVIETNLLGVLFSCRAVLPRMLQQGSGHIFIIASVSGRESYVGEPAYIATKWAQVGLAHALRLELANKGIRVTAVEPGLVDTPLTRDNPRIRPLLEEIEPLSAEDIAQAVIYAYRQPEHVAVTELVIRPRAQGILRIELDD
jgi:NADP-dependent 3-hydroxy acid dehydrogenase YdfG